MLGHTSIAMTSDHYTDSETKQLHDQVNVLGIPYALFPHRKSGLPAPHHHHTLALHLRISNKAGQRTSRVQLPVHRTTKCSLLRPGQQALDPDIRFQDIDATIHFETDSVIP